MTLPSPRHLLAGLRRLLHRDQDEAELDDELRHYVDLATAEHIHSGVAPAEARRKALAAIGGMESVKDEVRGGGWEARVEALWQDLRFAVRTLQRNLGFTLAALATLAIGIAATTTVFSVVNAVFLRPPPEVRAPEQLVSIFTSDFSGPPYGGSSWPDFEDLRDEKGVFDDVMAYTIQLVGVGEGDALERTAAEVVSVNYFTVLGVRPALGRFFAADEGTVGAGRSVAVISHSLWQRRYASAPSAVGETVRLNGSLFTIVGVTPTAFAGGQRGVRSDVWVPAAVGIREATPRSGGEPPRGPDDVTRELHERGNRGYVVMARLASGATVGQAQSAMTLLARRLLEKYPDNWRDVNGTGRRLSVLPERDARVPPQARTPVMGFLALLMGMVTMVLLLCCANVASLTLARVARRSREIGVRLSLGAGRWRVLRLLLAEGLVLGVLGGIAGTVLAFWATRALMTLQPPGLPVRIAVDLSLDRRVLFFAALVTAATGLLFAALPALRASRAGVFHLMKRDGLSAPLMGRRISLQNALVVSQMSVSLLLLVGALLFLNTVSSATAIDLGFPTSNLLLVSVEPRPDVSGGPEAGSVMTRLRDRMVAIPGVERVSWSSNAALGLGLSRRGISVEGYRPRPGEDMEFPFAHVGPDYFETMRIPLARGRGIAVGDRAGAPAVVVVNEAFARRYLSGGEVLGRRISTGGDGGPWMDVVGIARDARITSLTEPPRPYVYYPSLQAPASGILHLRTTVPPRSLVAAVQRAIATEVPEWSIMATQTMEEQVGAALLPQRIASTALSLFGILTLFLATVGLYGVIAYSVAARARELGVRSALGARRRDVIQLVLRQGARLAAWGVVFGVPVAWGASRLLTGFLVGGEASSIAPFAGAAAVLFVAALAASWLPARRAAAVHPMSALRTD